VISLIEVLFTHNKILNAWCDEFCSVYAGSFYTMNTTKMKMYSISLSLSLLVVLGLELSLMLTKQALSHLSHSTLEY
jgi:hypothetical protein